MQHSEFREEISAWDVDLLIMSSQLHDVGKISIKDNILMKPSRLNEEEFEEMKKHTSYGVDIILRIEESTTENAFLYYAEIMAGYHHERWDGKGYPYGLKGNEIPLQGRLMAIIDVYDALTNDRPYKKAFSHETAVGIIKEGHGTQFDPLICEVFLDHEKQFRDSVVASVAVTDDEAKLNQAMKAIANAVSMRSGKTHGHVEKIRQYLEIFVGELKGHKDYEAEVSNWDNELFLISADMHDVGKIAVADHILSKTDELSDSEYEDVKSHVDVGVKVIQQVKENVQSGGLLHHAEASVGSHHEKWDGTGYPNGLKGSEIPLQGRIMAIVDVYLALISDRPHRGKRTHSEAVEIIRNGGGTHFDPKLVDVFVSCEKAFEKVIAEV
jgi:HD-GYP domain-containing protein (c-di-GMP phosphodiesterase class II)